MVNTRFDQLQSDDPFPYTSARRTAQWEKQTESPPTLLGSGDGQTKASTLAAGSPLQLVLRITTGIMPKALAEQAFRLLVSIRRAGFL
jgi:hypothetical protein